MYWATSARFSSVSAATYGVRNSIAKRTACVALGIGSVMPWR